MPDASAAALPVSQATPVDLAWVARYLRLLGLDGHDRAPTYNLLAAITRAHIKRVPFESLTTAVRRHEVGDQPIPEVDRWERLDAWERSVSGGVCFDSATMLWRLLAALGYACHQVLADFSFPASHQAIRVHLDGRDYLVDAAAGQPLFEPIPLDRQIEIHHVGLGFRFGPATEPGVWHQERFIDGTWTHFAHYRLAPPDPAEQEDARVRHLTPGCSWVVDCLRLVTCDEDRVLALRDQVLHRFTLTGKHTETLTEPDAIERVVHVEMGLPGFPVRACIAALAARGIGPCPDLAADRGVLSQ